MISHLSSSSARPLGGAAILWCTMHVVLWILLGGLLAVGPVQGQACEPDLCVAQVDIYSMGIILWELVTLQTPSRGNLRPMRIPEECPPEIARLIERCLVADNPGARPTAAQIFDCIMARCAKTLTRGHHIPSLQTPACREVCPIVVAWADALSRKSVSSTVPCWVSGVVPGGVRDTHPCAS